MYWELWDIESKNLVETFDAEDEALQGVREILAVNTPEVLDALALAAMYEEGESRDVELPPALRGEELRARLTEIAQQVSAADARNVHERIRKWLAEENWHIRDVDDPRSSFNVMATLETGQRINIYQLKDHLNHVTIHEHVVFDDTSKTELQTLSDSILREITWNIYRDTALIGVDLQLPSASLSEMHFYAFAYFDALTKDLLIQRILLILRAATLSLRTIAKSFVEAGRPPEAASNLLHLVPPVGASLAAAS